MAERKKVIEGLECCVRHFGECESCPYDEGRGNCGCGKQLYADALTLLEVQEVRVMTLEEVKRLAPDNDVWIEYHELAGWTISAVTVREIDDNGMLCRLQCLTFGFDRYGCYGGDWMAWRCWTSRPTDEQREATPWQ